MNDEYNYNYTIEKKKNKKYSTWARSPSYFHSHVNFKPSNRLSTSCTPLVGCANIGFKGIPGVNLQLSGKALTPTSRIIGIIMSRFGLSL